MKTFIFSSLFSLLFLSQPFAQTVDEILEKYFEVNGQDKLLQTNTYISTGKVIQGEYEIPFKAYYKRPMKYRSEATFQGMEIVTAYDGESGWNVSPFAGSTDPQPMTDEQNERMKLQADYDGMFYNYKEKGNTIELVGKEDIDDIETYVLKLTRPNGDVITSYIDAENYVLLKTVSKTKVQGVEREFETIFSNYKYTDGILRPFAVETKTNGQTMMQVVFDSFEYDVDIPDSLFVMPEVTAPSDSIDVK